MAAMTGMNSTIYAEDIIQDRLGPIIASLELEGRPYPLVVEDGAPIHWSKISLSAKGELDMANLAQPPCSPDLNPIKNIWALRKGILRKLHRVPTNKGELWEAIQKAWDEIPIEAVNKCVMSLHRRGREVLEQEGGPVRG
jgi:hypothetical protein